jgi:hypothetical protein
MQRTDGHGGNYSLAADSTRFFLGTYQHMRAHSATCHLCRLIVNEVEGNARCAAIALSTTQLLCVIRSSKYDYGFLTIGAPAPSRLMFQDTALVSLTVAGDYLDIPKRSVVDKDSIRTNLLRDWLEVCSQAHTACAQVGLQKKDNALKLSTFKVIDVEKRLVVPAPKDAPYVALSYVWGQAEMYKARKQDFIFSKKRSHDGCSAKVLPLDAVTLPATVEDAIRVVRQLGQRFLWIDAICITQDDPEELQATLQQMHLVYGNALVTVCAMDGASADAGLARITPSPNQDYEPTADLGGKLVLAPSDFYEFPKMNWATRAWTYQEAVYSTRCILFTADRVFYSCGQGLHSEEREAGISITSGLDTTLPHHRAGSGNPVVNTASSNITPFDEYAYHVESFSERKLSFQSDALRAFTAVMSDMSTKLGLHFVWGLPIEMFELALCWTPAIVTPSPGDMSEEDCLVTFSKSRLLKQAVPERRSGFPSWAWTGHRFEAAVLYPTEIRSILQTQGTLVSHIEWPWKKGTVGSHAPDTADTGNLDIEVELVSMTRPERVKSFLIDDEDDDIHFDDLTVWTTAQTKTCIRICETITTFNIWDGFGLASSISSDESDNESDDGGEKVESDNNDGDNQSRLTVFLTVVLMENGMYERDGLFVMYSADWDEQRPKRERIRLR